MKYLPVVLTTALLLGGAVPAVAAERDCLGCHREKTPGVVAYWEDSLHGAKGIGCARCHGHDYGENHPGEGDRRAVTVTLCGECHERAAREHLGSKHGIGFRAGRACTRNEPRTPETLAGCDGCHEKGSSVPREDIECARFLAQTPEMRRQGCLACHRVEQRCDTCHGSHGTDLAVARDPAVCATCHMGPDHPQFEMWGTSLHGILFRNKGVNYAPDCGACHMPEGTHNVSRGITMGLAGQPYSPEIRERERAQMLAVCSRCHTEGFARRNLRDGDEVQQQAKHLVDEGAAIVRALQQEGLLYPAPGERPPHPLMGHTLELGAQMLYEDLSRPEAIFFRMKKFYYVITYKGVYHQNPDYAHWYGNAPLKLALSELRSEAAVLREIGRLSDRLDNLVELQIPATDGDSREDLKRQIRLLREDYLRGTMSREEFEQRKDSLLKQHGL